MDTRKGLLIFNICLILAFAGAAVAAAKWTTVRVGNLILKVEGKLSPRAFPRRICPRLLDFPEQRPIVVDSPVGVSSRLLGFSPVALAAIRERR